VESIENGRSKFRDANSFRSEHQHRRKQVRDTGSTSKLETGGDEKRFAGSAMREDDLLEWCSRGPVERFRVVSPGTSSLDRALECTAQEQRGTFAYRPRVAPLLAPDEA